MKLRSLAGPVLFLALGGGAVACGGSQERGVMSQEERLAEQERLAAEQAEKEKEYSHKFDEATSDTEENQKFDKGNAEHELKRASLSAADCPNTLLPEDLKTYQPGTARLKIVFGNDGSVKDVVLAPPYAETTVGNCVLRAIEPVLIKPYDGAEQSMDWEIELPAPTKKEPEKPAKKK